MLYSKLNLVLYVSVTTGPHHSVHSIFSFEHHIQQDPLAGILSNIKQQSDGSWLKKWFSLGSNWEPSVCETEIITTRPLNRITIISDVRWWIQWPRPQISYFFDAHVRENQPRLELASSVHSLPNLEPGILVCSIWCFAWDEVQRLRSYWCM